MTSRTDAKEVVRLARHGTAIPRSSTFTRAATILHTTDIEVKLDGARDDGGSASESTAGVDFLSAQIRLNRIFQKNALSKDGTAPPPPPRRLSPPSATLASATPSQLLASSSVSSGGSSTPDNMSQPASPPVEGLDIRTPARHRKLITTRLQDLPEELQEQQPNIRGGVAVYRVSDAAQQEKYGGTIEINAIEYILKLRHTITELERKVQKLEDGRSEASTIDHQRIRSMRKPTFIGKRSKESQTTVNNEKTGRSIPRGKTFMHVDRSRGITSKPSAESQESSGKTPINSQLDTAAVEAPEPAKPAVVSFPDGFGCEPPSSNSSISPGSSTRKPIPKGKTFVNVDRNQNTAPSLSAIRQGSPGRALAKPQRASVAVNSSTPAKPAVNFPDRFGCEPQQTKLPMLPVSASAKSGESNADKVRSATTGESNAGQVRSATTGKPNFGQSRSAHIKVNSRPASEGQANKRKPSVSWHQKKGSKGIVDDTRVPASLGEKTKSSAMDAIVTPKQQRPEAHASSGVEPQPSTQGDRSTAPMPRDGRRMNKIGKIVRSRSFIGIKLDSTPEKTDGSRAEFVLRSSSMNRDSPPAPEQEEAKKPAPTPTKTRRVRKLLGRR